MDKQKDENRGSAGIVVTKNGPYLVSGAVPLAVQVIGANADGDSVEWTSGALLEPGERYALCRCGHTGNAPFCDGAHAKMGFDGTETASRERFDAQKTVYAGADLLLEDVRPLCAGARFCDTYGTAWEMINKTDEAGAREILARQVANCPSGRLVLRDKATTELIEPRLEPAIGVVEDPAQNCSGPLWVRGGIPIQSADGHDYEVRNRVTLCRCGASKNKPFCDATHMSAGYRDGRPDAPAGV